MTDKYIRYDEMISILDDSYLLPFRKDERLRGLSGIDVVRCKDCLWYENRYGEVCHNPRYGDGHANYSPPYVDGEYFCKDGERSEE